MENKKSSYQTLRDKLNAKTIEYEHLLKFIRDLDRYSDKPKFDKELFKIQKELVGDDSGKEIVVNLMKLMNK